MQETSAEPARLRSGWSAAAERALASAWLPWLLIAAGAALRLRRYQACFSLEVAESELALNLLSRSYADLLRPLDYDQAAPIGFLWVQRFFVSLLGGHEYVLRLFPLLCALASLLFFRAAARRILSPAALPFALALFAFSPLVIWYSAQAKQYSVDVAVAALLLALAAGPVAAGRLAPGRGRLLALLGALVIWLSHASAFTLAGIGLVLFGAALPRRGRRELAGLLVMGGMWGASFLAFFILSLRNTTQNDYLQEYWRGSFMPLPPRSFDDFQWFVDTFFAIFREPEGLVFEGLAGTLFLLGAVFLARRRRPLAWLLLLPIFLTLLASGLHGYPFGNRLILFLVPTLCLVIAEGIELLRRHTWATAPWIPLLFAGVLLFDSMISESLKFLRPRPTEELRPVMAQLSEKLLPGDVIYLYWDTHYAFRYYAPRFGLAERPVVVGRSSESVWSDDLADLEALRGQPRVWLLFSHVYEREAVHSEEDFFLFHLDRMGRRLDTLSAPGASAHLYDLRDAGDPGVPGEGGRAAPRPGTAQGPRPTGPNPRLVP